MFTLNSYNSAKNGVNDLEYDHGAGLFMGGDSPDKETTITVTAKGFSGDCLYEGAEITAEVLSYEDYIERSSTKETIDSDGEAQFVVTGKKTMASAGTI